jgi:hypothetical protein
MSVQLEIQDGSPYWWLSPNIWTVPGNDPEGPPGLPIVGQSCYVWAHVLNTGGDPVQNATVRFYWANPSVGFDRNSANHIGDANVTLGGPDAQDVLCLVPWHPAFAGHECVLAEVFQSTADPLPPVATFNVPTDRHVAQRNLSVVSMTAHLSRFAMPFSICNTSRVQRRFAIRTESSPVSELRPLAKHLGTQLPKGTGKLINAGFVQTVNLCDNEAELLACVDGMLVEPGQTVALSLVGELEGDAALVHVIQKVDGSVVGGLSVLAARSKSTRTKGKN